MSSATLSATPVRATVGQSVLLTLTVHNDAAALADPATATISLLAPDGTTSTVLMGALTHVSTGLYTYPFTGILPGEFQPTVVTTVPNATASTSFTLDPAAIGRLGSGYVTVAEFKAMPTRLAVDQLTVGAAARMQDAELAAILSRSSVWADSYCQSTLGANSQILLRQAKADIHGDVRIPVGASPKLPVQVTGVSWGGLRTALTALSDLSGTFADRGIVTTSIGSFAGSWQGALQLNQTAPGQRLWVQLGLIVGWPNTVLTADQAAGDSTVHVLDPAGIVAGTVLQLTNPGVEESVTVLSIAGNILTLTAGLLNAQTSGCGITAVPSDVREAVAYAACARITTPGTETNPLPGASLKGPGKSGAADLSYQGQAECMLDPYRRRLP